MYDVRNLKPWVYARSSSHHPEVLIRQMKGLLTDAEQNGWQIVGTSQDIYDSILRDRMSNLRR